MDTFTTAGSIHQDHGDRSGDFTHAEATTMLCAGAKGFGRVMRGIYEAGAVNPEFTERLCVGTRCMAWKWGTPLIERSLSMYIDAMSNRVRQIGNEEFPVGQHKKLEDTRPEGDGWFLSGGDRGMAAFWYRPTERRGHCMFVRGLSK
jgi:hypothetical protein